jgi:hypothetical protein
MVSPKVRIPFGKGTCAPTLIRTYGKTKKFIEFSYGMGVVGGFFFKRTVLSVVWVPEWNSPGSFGHKSNFFLEGQRRSLALHPMIANTNPRLTEGGRYHCLYIASTWYQHW